MDDDDYGYDEGSDVDNWEAEQCFQDARAEDREQDEADEAPFDDEDDFEGVWDEESEMERRAEYAGECALGFGE